MLFGMIINWLLFIISVAGLAGQVLNIKPFE